MAKLKQLDVQIKAFIIATLVIGGTFISMVTTHGFSNF